MIYQEDKERSQVAMNAEIHSMGIESNSKSIMVMVDRLYQKKREAVARELGANAMDAHRIIGNPEPFTIIMPSAADPNITFIDNGPGLSWEDKKKYLGTLFASSKDGENVSVGHYGLGSKSPHTVSQSYAIESRHDGKLIKSVWFRDGDMPKFMKVSEEPYEGPTGITFRIPVRADSYNEWIDAIRTQCHSMVPQPKVISLGIEVQVFTPDVKVAEFGNVALYTRNYLGNFFGETMVNMGGILYPIRGINNLENSTLLRAVREGRGTGSSLQCVITVPIGAVLPPPHREALEDCPVTQSGINKEILESNRLFEESHVETFDAKGLDIMNVSKRLSEHRNKCWEDSKKYFSHEGLQFFSFQRLMRGARAAVTELIDDENEKLKYHKLMLGHNDSISIAPRSTKMLYVKHSLWLSQEQMKRVDRDRLDISYMDATGKKTVGGAHSFRLSGQQLFYVKPDTRQPYDLTIISSANYYRESVFTLEEGARFIYQDKDLGKQVLDYKQRRWVHAALKNDVDVVTPDHLREYDTATADEYLETHRGGFYALENYKSEDPKDLETIAAARAELMDMLGKFKTRILMIPKNVSIPKTTKQAAAERLNLSGLRVLRGALLRKQRIDDEWETPSFTPAWVQVPSMKVFEENTTYTTAAPREKHKHYHVFVYAGDTEAFVFLDAGKTVKVSKDWLVQTLNNFYKVMDNGSEGYIIVEAIRLGVSPALKTNINQIKQGWSEEIPILQIWHELESDLEGARYRNPIIRKFDEAGRDSEICKNFEDADYRYVFNRYRNHFVGSVSILAAVDRRLTDTRIPYVAKTKGYYMLQAVMYAHIAVVCLHSYCKGISTYNFDLAVKEYADGAWTGFNGPTAVGVFWAKKVYRLTVEATTNILKNDGDINSDPIPAVQLMGARVITEVRKTDAYRKMMLKELDKITV